MTELGGNPDDTRVAAAGVDAQSRAPRRRPRSPAWSRSAAPSSSTSGDREVGQRIYAWFTLTNTGGQPIDLEGIRLAIRGPGRVVRDLVSDEPLTLAAGQSIEVSSSWPLDLAGRWHGWIEVTREGKASLVGDEQAFGFWVRLPKDFELPPLGAAGLHAQPGALTPASGPARRRAGSLPACLATPPPSV